MSAAATLQVRNLSIMFGGVHAVEDVSFDVEPGEVFAIIGPNGAEHDRQVSNLECGGRAHRMRSVLR